MNKIKIIGTALLGLIGISVTFAQSETSAIRIGAQPSNNIGSARYQAMAGSMGAIGAEYSSVNTNPAGIGLFRNNGKLSFTLGFNNPINESNWYNSSNKQNGDFEMKFNDLSYMSSWIKSAGVGFSFGFGIQRGASFDRDIKIGANMNGQGSSLADYLAASINRYKGKEDDIPNSEFLNKGAYGNRPWLMVLGVRNGWVNSDNGKLYYTNFRVNSGSDYSAGLGADFSLRERGSSMRYNFSASFDLSNNFYAGLVLNITSLNHQLYTVFDETHLPETGVSKNEFLTLRSSQNTKGTGLDIGVGILAEPISGLRVGGAIFTPTFYTFTQDYMATASSYVDKYVNDHGTPTDGGTEFAMSSPWRFTLSGAYVFGRRAIINVDYELSLLGSIKLDEPRNHDVESNLYGSVSDLYKIDNGAIKEDYGVRHTIRIGGELNITNRFALRGGFAYASSGVKDNVVKDGLPTRELLVDGLSPSYTLVDNYKTLSLGLGYKITPNWALDISFVDDITKSNVYTFPVINDPSSQWIDPNKKPTFLEGYEPIKYTQHLLRGAMTLSYRF